MRQVFAGERRESLGRRAGLPSPVRHRRREHACDRARALGARALESPLKRDTYECGEEPEGPAWLKFHPRYYVVALVFVLFDVEAAFLFPWAISVGKLGLIAIIDMLVFIGILMLGWLYALKKGALDWH
ncbi:MAG: NADH-quinone oxidoreductase subunit A [Myxococcales bacterium]|nr:NADH-quinone oxidoreductase subunit A [Myxococcales bacterium]